MSIFKNFFGNKESKDEHQFDNSKYRKINKSSFDSFQELVEQNAGLSFEKQLDFGQIIGSSSWQFDMGNGQISFGSLEFPIQIIGSLSFNDNSWMWGWANAKSGMPENLLTQSNQIKEIGEQKNIQELTIGHFNVEEGFEHKIGMMACGLFDSKSYYCANYGQGTLVLTIGDNGTDETYNDHKVERVLTVFPQLISSLDLNHRRTFKNYLIDRNFKLSESENTIEGLQNEQLIVADFDGTNRLTSLKKA